MAASVHSHPVGGRGVVKSEKQVHAVSHTCIHIYHTHTQIAHRSRHTHTQHTYTQHTAHITHIPHMQKRERHLQTHIDRHIGT